MVTKDHRGHRWGRVTCPGCGSRFTVWSTHPVTHPLKGSLTGQCSIWVNGNWRVPFRFIDSDVELVDYQDYH